MSAAQLPMFSRTAEPSLAILPADHFIVMKNLKGERDALAHAEERVWSGLRPLFESPGRGTVRPTVNHDTIKGWLARLDAVLEPGHPVYLQFPDLTEKHLVASKRQQVPALIRCFQVARALGLTAVPAVALSADAKVLSLVADIALEDQRGVCVRYDPRAVRSSASSVGSYFDSRLETLGLTPAGADLVVDFGYLADDRTLEPADALLLLADLPYVGEWRSFVFLGTSVPPTLGRIRQGSVGTLPRTEWQLWTSMAPPSGRPMTFGDYGIQGVKDPDQAGGMGMRANVRYTGDDVTVVARGTGPVAIGGNEQYVGLCQDLLQPSIFRGAAYSWGDQLIDSCAAGQLSPGAQPMWRGAGLSHHLVLVREQLNARVEAGF